MASRLRVLVLFAHPAIQKSRINRHLVAAARGVEGVTVHDLYEAYPDFDIDIVREQELLLTHDAVVLQHPFFWYSCPALLKEWIDLVLEHGFAYGHGGTRLHGKTLVSAITAGGSEHAYRHEGHNHFTIRELLAPFEQTARLCGMHWLPPFVVHGSIHLTAAAEIERTAADYARVLAALRDGHLTPARTAALPRLNHDLAALGL
jgi:glutathione-regulated potassium-efflux system ancillary protein KefG